MPYFRVFGSNSDIDATLVITILRNVSLTSFMLDSWNVSSSLVYHHRAETPFYCSFMYSLSYLQASYQTECGLRNSLRMTLAHYFPPCSQMCRYSCLWTTLPCTILSLLTWGCLCVDWRFSTNH